MKYFTWLLASSIMAIIFSCHAVPMSQEYYQKNSKVGVLSLVDTISVVKKGGQGLLDMAISSGRKYKDALQDVKPSLSSSEKVTKELVHTFEAMNKTVVVVNDNLPIKQFTSQYKPYKNPNPEKGKKYFEYDLRKLKEELGLDEIVVIQNMYGLAISYHGFIEIGKEGYSNVVVAVVNLEDNSVLFRDNSLYTTVLKGKWDTPPNYDNLKNTIQKAIDDNSTKIRAKIVSKSNKN